MSSHKNLYATSFILEILFKKKMRKKNDEIIQNSWNVHKFPNWIWNVNNLQSIIHLHNWNTIARNFLTSGPKGHRHRFWEECRLCGGIYNGYNYVWPFPSIRIMPLECVTSKYTNKYKLSITQLQIQNKKIFSYVTIS